MKETSNKILRPTNIIKLVAPDIDITTYREFDTYKLDMQVYEERKVFIPSALPSEPPEGITYTFGPSGYIGDITANNCIIPTTWRNVNNYCHWNFSELPFLFLAFESTAKNLFIPEALVDSQLPFQKRWMELLYSLFPEKKVNRLSQFKFHEPSFYPVNHDTSTNESPIGKCQYKHYHHSRATPYAIDRFTDYKKYFKTKKNDASVSKYVYITRTTRTLKNESEVQSMVQGLGFELMNLEKLTLDEQIGFFSNAKAIIGFHGAGLSNLLFCPPSTKVFEIVDKDCVYPSYIDGVIIPGRKATRTYFHMLSRMKHLDYYPIESHNYLLDVATFENQLISLLSIQ